MKQNLFKLIAAIRPTFYEGEGGQQPGTAAGNPNPESQVPPPVTKLPLPVTFTAEQQTRLNELLAEERRKAQETAQKQNQKTIEQLETLKQNQNLTQQEKDRLSAQIEDLRTQFQTKEQQAQTEYTKLQKQYTTETKALTGERDTWKNRYESEVKRNQILEACREHKAISSEQIEAIVTPMIKIVEEMEDGKPTGNMVARANFMGKDKDGKPIKLELSVSDAVKAMREWPEKYGNLFQSDAKGGTGQVPNNGSIANSGSGGVPDLEKMSPQDYAKNRDKIRQQMANAE